MLMPGRHASAGDQYSYGFQGELIDDEIKGEGNSINYKYRMHDPRIGRFFAVDPLAPKYPHNSPYAFSENKVIAWVELEGLESGPTTSTRRPVAYRAPGGRVVNTVVGVRTHMNQSFSRLSTSRGGLRTNMSQSESRNVDEFSVQPTSLRNGSMALSNLLTVKEAMDNSYALSTKRLVGSIEIKEVDYFNQGNVPYQSDQIQIKFSNANDEKIMNNLEAEFNNKVNSLTEKILNSQGYNLISECIPCTEEGKEVYTGKNNYIPAPEEKLREAMQGVQLFMGPSPKQRLISEVKKSPSTKTETEYVKQSYFSNGN